MPSNEFARHNKETSRSGLLLPVEYLRNGERYLSFVFSLANRKSHATKRCNPRLCGCYRFWVANIKTFKIFDFDVEFPQAKSYKPSTSYGLIKKYRVELLFFASIISGTVRDIRVPFSLCPRARVVLPNGANLVSVVVVVPKIWSRQHQDFRMLTCSSERNQYPSECIRTAINNEIYICEAVCEAVRKKNTGTKEPDRHLTVRWLSNNIFSTIQPSRSWRDRRPTVKQLCSEVSSN